MTSNKTTDLWMVYEIISIFCSTHILLPIQLKTKGQWNMLWLKLEGVGTMRYHDSCEQLDALHSFKLNEEGRCKYFISFSHREIFQDSQDSLLVPLLEPLLYILLSFLTALNIWAEQFCYNLYRANRCLIIWHSLTLYSILALMSSFIKMIFCRRKCIYTSWFLEY